jgi:hypothetical protein
VLRNAKHGNGRTAACRSFDLRCDGLGQVEGEGVLVMPEYIDLHRDLWERQQNALRRSRPEAAEEAAAARTAAAASGLPDISEQPDWVVGGRLYPHQLAAVNWLRRQWLQGCNAMLADETGLGKAASAITFCQCLRLAPPANQPPPRMRHLPLSTVWRRRSIRVRPLALRCVIMRSTMWEPQRFCLCSVLGGPDRVHCSSVSLVECPGLAVTETGGMSQARVQVHRAGAGGGADVDAGVLGGRVGVLGGPARCQRGVVRRQRRRARGHPRQRAVAHAGVHGRQADGAAQALGGAARQGLHLLVDSRRSVRLLRTRFITAYEMRSCCDAVWLVCIPGAAQSFLGCWLPLGLARLEAAGTVLGGCEHAALRVCLCARSRFVVEWRC